MKILITGVTGFIGSHVSNKLYDSHHILGISRKKVSSKNHEYFCIDLTDNNGLEKIIKENPDIDIIIHSAALAHNKGNDLSFEKFKKVNYEVTTKLVDLSNQYLNLKKFIFLSTISVYGERLEKDIYLEDDTCIPKSPYAITKKMSEDYIQKYCNADYYILRLSPVYSDDFKLNIKRRTEIKSFNYIVGNGKNELSLCNVKNISHTINEIINGKVKPNEIYNIADEKSYTFNDMLKINNKSNLTIKVPKSVVKVIYNVNKLTKKSRFIEENAIKLLSSCVYSTKKIQKNINLSHDLFE